MEAFRRIIEKSEAEVRVALPEALQGRRLEIIVLADEDPIFQKGSRPIGLLKGQIHLTDSFFEALPDDLLKAFGAQ